MGGLIVIRVELSLTDWGLRLRGRRFPIGGGRIGKVREIMLAAYSPTVLPQENRVIPPHVFIHVNHHLQHYSTSAFTQSPCGESGGEYCDTQRSGRRRRCIGAEEHRNAKSEPNRLISRWRTRRRHFSHLEHPAFRRCSASFVHQGTHLPNPRLPCTLPLWRYEFTYAEQLSPVLRE